MQSLTVKRTIDIVVSAVALSVAALPMSLVALLVARRMGRPVLFHQVRPGLGGEPFELHKFRTMKAGGGSDEERLTPLGSFLRSSSIDELPELWNVLRGDMSLVGPRPLLNEYLDLYNPEQAQRHLMRPGLTGLAQVNGRNLSTWEQRFAFDLRYIRSWSVVGDLKIIARTVVAVLRRSGISADGEATMAPFAGSNL